MGDITFESDAPKQAEKKGYNRWSWRYEQTTRHSKFKTVEMLDRVYIYLMDKDSPVCYWRGQAKDFMKPFAPNKWIPLKTDRAIAAVDNDYDAGML